MTGALPDQARPLAQQAPCDRAIWVITHSAPGGPELPEGSSRTSKGWPSSSSHQRYVEPRASSVSTDKLEREMGKFLGAMGRVFDQAQAQAQKRQGLCLAEIELAVEIGAEGEVRLVGVAGGKATGRGAITLTFRRTEGS